VDMKQHFPPSKIGKLCLKPVLVIIRRDRTGSEGFPLPVRRGS
jgi:hypothetical protein